jgi:hypothetical protein
MKVREKIQHPEEFHTSKEKEIFQFKISSKLSKYFNVSF